MEKVHDFRFRKTILRQTEWTQIRLLLQEQSDLGPHCLGFQLVQLPVVLYV